MSMTVEEIAKKTGTSIAAACRTLLRLIDLGLIQPVGNVDEARADLQRRLDEELSH